MKKLQPGDKIVKIDEELGIAWILLPPDASLGGFQGISPRIMDEEKFTAAKKNSKKNRSISGSPTFPSFQSRPRIPTCNPLLQIRSMEGGDSRSAVNSF